MANYAMIYQTILKDGVSIMSFKISVAVCEDEPNIREEISNLVQNSGILCRTVCYCSADALLKSGENYDIYILDIQMPGVSGMDFARQIRAQREHPGPIIFFVSALADYMQSAFDVQAYHFLIKPIDEKKFQAVLAGAAEECLRRGKREFISVKIGGNTCTVALYEILFIESFKKQIVIHTTNGEYAVYGKISDFAEKLKSSPGFFRCHRCYIVNMEHILRFNTKTISLKSGQDIFLSRENYLGFVKAYASFAMQ
jgi:DNA-binding LytR/AlgR family response regulator